MCLYLDEVRDMTSSHLEVLSFTHYDSLIDALNEFKDDPLEFKPGTSFLYTTYGYTILGAIIEKVSGKSFAEHMRENIFLPAGMTDTKFEDSNEQYTNQAKLYINYKKYFIKSPKTDLSIKYPGGGYLTTARDMLLFGKALLDDKLIKESTFQQMTSEDNYRGAGMPYGFGWFIFKHERKGKILMHGGSQSGASSEFNLMLDHEVVTVALSNSFGNNSETQQLVFQLANEMYDYSK